MEQVLFLLFAGVAIGSGIMVVIARNPIHSALALIVALVQVAAVFVLLHSPFLAVVQIFVYVGAVMVLFLFVIIMLDIRKQARAPFLDRAIAPALVILVLLGGEMIALLVSSERLAQLSASPQVAAVDQLKGLSKSLFADYLLPFEVASVVLLVALVGAIVLARKDSN